MTDAFSRSFDLARFAKPGGTWRTVPFWSWNGRMEPGEVRRQVREFAAAGYGGVMIHARIGLLTPYLGEEWFGCCDAAIEEARACGLSVWLYDEDKWPSGFGGGEVTLERPDNRMQLLTVRPSGAPVPEGAHPIGERTGDWQCLVWTCPPGDPNFNGACYTSLLKREAVRSFLDLAYEPYARRYGRDFGGLIPAIFTDEPSTLWRRRIITPAVPFADPLIGEFRALNGYDPLPHLAKLFFDLEGAAEFRLHYYRVVNRMFEHNFTGQLAAWCRSRGLAFTGHYLHEGGLYEQQFWGVDIMPNYRHLDIPGIDHLGLQVREVTTAIQCRSAANQYGKPRMLSEFLGVAGQGVTMADRQWLADQQLCLGVNQFVEHLAAYTLEGCRKRDFPPAVSFQQPWWPMSRAIQDYQARLCAALAQGKYQADFGIIHPQDSIAALWTPAVDPRPDDQLIEEDDQPLADSARKAIGELGQIWQDLSLALLGDQRTFDYLHEQLLSDDGAVGEEDGRPVIHLGRMNYPLVVMPGMMTIRASTLECLLEFSRRGGSILHTGPFPNMVDGRSGHSGLRKLRAAVESLDGPAQLAARLRELLPPAVDLLPHPGVGSRCWVHRRQVGSDRLLFLANLDRLQGWEGTVCWSEAVGREISRLDAESGGRAPVGPVTAEGAFSLRLAPGESVLFWAGNVAAAGAQPAVVSESATDRVSLAPWKVERTGDNALPLDSVRYSFDGRAWSEREVPLMALQEFLNGSRYRGPLRLRFHFHNACRDGAALRLIVERRALWEITCNGQPVPPTGQSIWRDPAWRPVDIGPLVRAGENILELGMEDFRFGDLAAHGSPEDRYGTELENLILLGDFGVECQPGQPAEVSPLWSQEGLPARSVRTVAAPFTLIDPATLRPGDVTAQGLPFYAGTLRCLFRVEKALPSVTALALDDLMAVAATASLNGRTLGQFGRAPFVLSCPPLAPGDELELVLSNSLRNLLGPHHHAAVVRPDGSVQDESGGGLKPHDFPGLYTADPYRVRAPAGGDESWLRHWEKHGRHPGWRTDYLVESFGLTPVFVS